MLKVLELFGGIGAARKALDNIGIQFTVVDYVEIDKYAVKSYNAMYNEDYETQSVTDWDEFINVDLVFHGSPCQNFSKEGDNKGGIKGSGTKSSLLWETIRIVKSIKPQYIIWENVASVKPFDEYKKYLNELESLGYYNYEYLLNAKDYGIPQNRRRVFIISSLNELNLEFEESYNNDVFPYLIENDHKYFIDKYSLTLPLYKKNQLLIRTGTIQGYNVINVGDVIDLARPKSKTRRARIIRDKTCPTITTNQCLGVVTNDLRIRYLSAKEVWLLMGFSIKDYENALSVNSVNQLYKQAGNSIVVNVLEAIFKSLLMN